MKHIFRDLKLFCWIFLAFFIVVFLVVDGGTCFVILSYKIHYGIGLVKNELTRTPSFLSSSSSFSQKQRKEDGTTPSFYVQSIPFSTIPFPEEANKENIIVLPKFDIIAPIREVKSPNLTVIYQQLKKGVVLYPGSAVPGQGYSIIIGHSSQYPWRPGNYKRVFSLLSELKKGDKIYVFWEKKPLVFEVESKKIFLPWPKGSEITETIFPPSSQPTLILQSCWPVGVATKRIAVKTVLIK